VGKGIESSLAAARGLTVTRITLIPKSVWEHVRQAGFKPKGSLVMVVNDSAVQAMKKLHDDCESLSADISWGKGKETGSFSPKWSVICAGSILSVLSNGNLS
jgi:hypothetical protein